MTAFVVGDLVVYKEYEFLVVGKVIQVDAELGKVLVNYPKGNSTLDENQLRLADQDEIFEFDRNQRDETFQELVSQMTVWEIGENIKTMTCVLQKMARQNQNKE